MYKAGKVRFIIDAVKGYYFLVCDHAIAKYIENGKSTQYFQSGLHLNSIDEWDDLGEILELLKKQFDDAKRVSELDFIDDLGMLTIVGAKYQ